MGGQAGSSYTSSSITSTAGSTLIVICHAYNILTGLSGADVTDSKGNTYTLLDSVEHGSGGDQLTSAIWINRNGIRGGGHTFTVNPPGVGTVSAIMMELSSTTPLSFYSACTAHASDNTNTFGITAAAAVPATNIAIAACGLTDSGASASWTAPSGYSNIFAFGDGLSGLINAAFYKIGETGTPTLAMTYPQATPPVVAGLQSFWVFAEGLAPANIGYRRFDGVSDEVHTNLGNLVGVSNLSETWIVAYRRLGSTAGEIVAQSAYAGIDFWVDNTASSSLFDYTSSTQFLQSPAAVQSVNTVFEIVAFSRPAVGNNTAPMRWHQARWDSTNGWWEDPSNNTGVMVHANGTTNIDGSGVNYSGSASTLIWGNFAPLNCDIAMAARCSSILSDAALDALVAGGVCDVARWRALPNLTNFWRFDGNGGPNPANDFIGTSSYVSKVGTTTTANAFPIADTPIVVATATQVNSTSFPKPAGTVAGDVLVVMGLTYDISSLQTFTLAGWTLRKVVKDSGNGVCAFVADHLCTGSEGSTFTPTLGFGSYHDWMVYRLAGCDQSSWYDNGTTNSGTIEGATPTGTSFLTATDNELLLINHAGYNAAGSITADYTGFTRNVGPIDTVNYGFSKTQALAGTTGTATATLAGNTVHWANVMVAYKAPAVSSGPTTVQATMSAAFGGLGATVTATPTTPSGPQLVATAQAAGPTGGTSGAINTTGATLLVAFVSGNGTEVNTVAAVSDSKGNTWTARPASSSSNTPAGKLFYVANPTVGTGHTFTLSGANIYASVEVAAFSGVTTTSPFDGVENGISGGSTSPRQTGSITPSADNELVISAAGFEYNGAVSVDSGMTITHQTAFASGDHFGSAIAYKVQTAATAINPSWSGWAGSVGNALTAVSFKAAPPAGGSGVITYLGGVVTRNGGGDSNGYTTAAQDTTGADFIIVSYSGSATSQTLTDSKGNTWIPMTASTSGGGGQHRFYYAYNCGAKVGTGHTFTITGTSSFPQMNIAWYSGVLKTADPLDQWDTSGQIGPSVTAGPITPTVNGCLIATGFYHADGNNTRTLTGGCTMILDATSTVFGSNNGSFGHLVQQTTAAAISANWATTNTVQNDSTIASFKAEPAAGGPAASPLIFLPRPILMRR